VNYRALKPNAGRNVPGDPSYDPVVDEALQNEMMQKAAARNEALDRLQQARDAFKQRPSGSGGGLQPNPAPASPPSGCPPNCGNPGASGPSNKIIAGAAGINQILGGK
jgi:hypothetical protein